MQTISLLQACKGESLPSALNFQPHHLLVFRHLQTLPWCRIVLGLYVHPQVDVGGERLPTVEAHEGHLPGVTYQVVFQPYGGLEGGVTLGAGPVHGGALLVCEVAQPVEHDLEPPGEHLVTLFAGVGAGLGGRPVPVHPLHKTITWQELVIHLPLRDRSKHFFWW